MTDHPINTVVVDNVAVGKSSVRGYLKDRVRLRVESASEVVSNDYSDAFGLDLLGRIYDRDAGDRTTAHDGVTCLVDSTGMRFKLRTIGVEKRVSVRAATTTNITIATALNDGDTLQGLTLATGDLVAVMGQTDSTANRIVAVGASPAPPANYDTYDDYAGLLVMVQEGDHASEAWLSSANFGGTLGTDPIEFTQINLTVDVPVEPVALGDFSALYGQDGPTLTSSMITAAAGAGKWLQLARGTIAVAATLALATTVNVYGAGSGSGPGFINPSLGTSIRADFASGDVWSIQNFYGSDIRNLQFNTQAGTIQAASVYLGGEGYEVGDTITLAGGTYASPCVLTVTAVSGGAVTGVEVTDPGSYTVRPPVPPTGAAQASTSGIGTGARFYTTIVRTGGAYLHLTGGSVTQGRSIVQNLSFQGGYDGLKLTAPFMPLVMHNTGRDFANAGIIAIATAVEPSVGNIAFNQMWGLPTAVASYDIQGGYATLLANHSLGSQIGVRYLVSAFPSGRFAMLGAITENFKDKGFHALNASGQQGSQFIAAFNEYFPDVGNTTTTAVVQIDADSGGENPYWLTAAYLGHDVIRARNLKSNPFGASTYPNYYRLDGLYNWVLNTSIISPLSGDTSRGVYVGSGARYGDIFNLRMVSEAGSAVTKYDPLGTWSETQIHEFQGQTFAQMSALGTVANGSIFFVTDGKQGSAPFAGGGNGAFALCQNGVWVSTAGVYSAASTASLTVATGSDGDDSELLLTNNGNQGYYVRADRGDNRLGIGTVGAGDFLHLEASGTGRFDIMKIARSNANSAASAPGLWFTGTWFTGGTSTTTKPHLLIEPSGATSTAWATGGTPFGINAASGFGGNLFDVQLNGSARLHLTAAGSLVGLGSTWTNSNAIAKLGTASNYGVATFRAATNLNLVVTDVSSAISLDGINDASNTFIPMRFRAAQFLFNGDTVTGSNTTKPGLQVTATLNTTGVVAGAALFANITNTNSGAGSLLADMQVGGSSKWKVDLSGNEDIAGVYKVAGTQVLGARNTGWTASTGTGAKTGVNMDWTQSISASPAQSEVQAIVTQLSAVQKLAGQLQAALTTHGAIGA